MRRPSRLFRHVVGANPTEDPLVHHEPDDAFFLDIHRTRSRRFLVLELASHSTSEARYLSADEPAGEFRVVEPRRAGIEYSRHATTASGSTSSPTTGRPTSGWSPRRSSSPGRDHWTPVLPYRPEVKLDAVEAFERYLVLWERSEGLRQLRVLELETGEEHLVAFPEPVYTVRPNENPEFETTVFRFSYTSLVTPNSVVDYDLAARTWTVRKQTEVLGGYDPSRYRSERLFATAPDGTRVPVSLVYRLPLERDGRRPLLLQGYGSYGYSFDPAFSSNVLSLLDRGWVVAIAHIRGGEEMGRAWYEDGKLLRKRNTFTDFIAAAEHLVAEGYTAPDRLAITGGSAGGLLMGAVTNMRPDLFRAVVAEVPFVDVVNTMLDATLPLTVIEYDEWGNPNDPALLRVHPLLLSLRQRGLEGLPAHPGDGGAQRSPGGLLGAGEVDGQAAGPEDGPEPAAAPHQHGGWTRWGVGEVRPPAGGGVQVRVSAGRSLTSPTVIPSEARDLAGAGKIPRFARDDSIP